MKKTVAAVITVLMLCVFGGSFCFAAQSDDLVAEDYAGMLPDYDYAAIPEWDIMIMEPEEAVCVDEGDAFYIYAMEEGYIPYVMVTVYDAYNSEEEFFMEFTDYLESVYDDLEITDENQELFIEGGKYCEVDYTYSVEGQQIENRCIVRIFNGITYMFTSKEVPDLDLGVGSLLEDVVAGSYFLAHNQPVEHDAIEVLWEDAEEYAEENAEGSFVPIPETDFMMFLPDVFEIYELSEEDIEDYFTFMAGYGSFMATAQKIPVTEGFTLYDYRDVLELEDGVENMELYVLNGYLFLKYELPDSDMICFSCLSEDSAIIEFSFWPMSDQEMWEYIVMMPTSIQ